MSAMDLINDVDSDVDVIRTLAQLSELIDGEPDYFRHAIVLLAVIVDAAARIQTSMSLLTGKIRDCDEGDSQ
jgi:hypothetical protein